MSILKAVTGSPVIRAGAAVALAGAALVGFAGSSQAVAATYTISPKTGPTTAGAVVTITGSGFKTAAGVSNLFAGATAVQWTAATCPATHAAATATVLDSSKVAVQSATAVIVTAPALPLVASAATAFKVCVYGTANSNALLGSAAYTAYPVPTITAANVPASGPAFGGNDVVITGTKFSKASVVKFGSVVSPKITVASDGLSIVAQAPAQAAGAVAVTVTTEGGKNTVATASWDDYTYTDAVSVSPHWLQSTKGGVLTVSGVGFSTTLDTAVNASAGVVLSPLAAFDGTDAGNVSCGSVQVISDTQLVCAVANSIADGLYAVYVADDATSATPTAVNVLSSTSVVTVSGF